MERRTFLGMIAGCLLAAPRAARAQSATKIPRVGVLLFGTPDTDPSLKSFRAGLRDLGHVEGKTIALEFHYAGGKPERLPDLARDLVGTKPDVIFALGGDVAPFVRTATTTIPIVVAVSNDPVQSGLVATLARPGGNLTGVTFVSSDLAAKRMQLLKEIVPAISRVGVLWNPDHIDPEYRETQGAGLALGVAVHSLEVRGPSDLDRAFRAAAGARVEAIVVVSSRLLLVNQQPIMEMATRHRLVLVGGMGAWPQAGALFSYGPDLDVLVRQAATDVDKVLKGARPGDIPIVQPTKFELIINLKTAKTLGLTIPPSLLQRADQVIE
jgi:putative tryptophan/tyrosine transport system substrate-binding protein